MKWIIRMIRREIDYRRRLALYKSYGRVHLDQAGLDRHGKAKQR